MKQRNTTVAVAMVASAMALAACSGSPSADDPEYPTGDITWVIHAGAGGNSDLTARKIAETLQEELGVSIIVENRPGASGSLAVQHVAEQPADGYTIGYAPVEFGLFEGLGFDVALDDYDFLAQISVADYVIAVPAASPFETLEDLVAHAADETITVSNAGAGSLAGIVAEAFGTETDTHVSPVPFDGGAPAIAALVGEQVDAGVSLVGEAHQQHNDGSLRVLAVFADERHPLLPDVPTASELGYDIIYGAWGGVMAPAGLPESVRTTLEDAFEGAVNSAEVGEFLESIAATPAYRSGPDFAEFVKSESERFAQLLNQ